MSTHATTSAAVTDWLASAQVPMAADVPLGPRTWYGIGGRASVVASPVDAAQLAAIVRYGADHGVPVRVLGKGANLLVGDGVIDGVVVTLDSPHFRRIELTDGSTDVIAGGGADLEKLITTTVRAGLAGLEVLGGIPATVGGALRMNAGGAFGEIGPRVACVTVVEHDGSIATLGRESIEFGYRHSNLEGRIVADATFSLDRTDDQPALRQRLLEVVRYKKQSQPMAAASAGCTFKNPRGRSEHGAGKLIDLAGLKGARIGGAEVSAVHANFIIVHDGATASDVLALIDHVTDTVRDRFGVELEREVVVWE